VIQLTGLLGLALLLASPPGGAASAPSEELKALRSKLEALKGDIARGESSRSEAIDALKSSEQAISDANRKLGELAAAKAEANRQLDDVGKQRQEAEKRLGKQRELAARLLYQQYTAGPAGPLQALASGRNPNEMSRTSIYLDYIALARKDILDTLRDNAESLRQLSEESSKRQAELTAIEAAQVAARQRLDAERKNHQDALASIAAQLQRQRREARTLEQDEQRLTKLVQDLAKMLAARKPPPRATLPPPKTAQPSPTPTPSPRTAQGDSLFEQLKGKLLTPVRGELVGRFGSPRTDSGLSWRGLFFQAPAGREVKAVAAGLVVFADSLRGFGNLLILDHGDGFMSLYGNNEALMGRTGDSVRGGDTVATVGSSGANTASGLYFELRYQGKPFDPLGWLNLR
jgi:murein hydrolase activator